MQIATAATVQIVHALSRGGADNGVVNNMPSAGRMQEAGTTVDVKEWNVDEMAEHLRNNELGYKHTYSMYTPCLRV